MTLFAADPARMEGFGVIEGADGPVVVLHVIKYVDGAGGRDDMAAYQNAAGAVALPHGVRVAGWLDIEETFIGDGRSWDQARFIAFPSRAAFEAVMSPIVRPSGLAFL